MTNLRWADKDPNDIDDRGINWSARLGAGETIVASTWSMPIALTEVTKSIDGSTTLIRVSGGTAISDIQIVNSIVTSDGRQLDQTVGMRICHR